MNSQIYELQAKCSCYQKELKAKNKLISEYQKGLRNTNQKSLQQEQLLQSQILLLKNENSKIFPSQFLQSQRSPIGSLNVSIRKDEQQPVDQNVSILPELPTAVDVKEFVDQGVQTDSVEMAFDGRQLAQQLKYVKSVSASLQISVISKLQMLDEGMLRVCGAMQKQAEAIQKLAAKLQRQEEICAGQLAQMRTYEVGLQSVESFKAEASTQISALSDRCSSKTDRIAEIENSVDQLQSAYEQKLALLELQYKIKEQIEADIGGEKTVTREELLETIASQKSVIDTFISEDYALKFEQHEADMQKLLGKIAKLKEHIQIVDPHCDIELLLGEESVRPANEGVQEDDDDIAQITDVFQLQQSLRQELAEKEKLKGKCQTQAEQLKIKQDEIDKEKRLRLVMKQEYDFRKENLKTQQQLYQQVIDEKERLFNNQPNSSIVLEQYKASQIVLDNVEDQAPDNVEGQAPDNVDGQAPDNVDGQAPDNVEGPAPDIVEGQAPDNVDGQAPDIVDGQAPDIVDGQAPDIVDGQAPDIVDGQAPDNVDGQSLDAPDGM